MKTGKDNKLDFIKVKEGNYTIIVARQKRFVWMNTTESHYVYFLYITRQDKIIKDKETMEVGEYNILCICKMFSSFYELIKEIRPIAAEYVLDTKKIVETVMMCDHLLDPRDLDYNEKLMERDIRKG